MAIVTTFAPQDGRRLACRVPKSRTEYLEVASGLRLRVTAAGARSWSACYYSPTTRSWRRVRLGDAATMPLARARELARATLHAVEAEGRDPAAERRQDQAQEIEARRQRAEGRRAAVAARAMRRHSFVELVRNYVEFRRTTPSGRFKRPASKMTLANWSSLMRVYVEPLFGDKRPHELRPAHFLEAVETATKRGGASQGPRLREFLEAVWRWLEPRADAFGVALPPRSPISVRAREIGAANVQRDRVLSPRELWDLWHATDEDRQAWALRLMLLTAARVREATDLPWSELELEAAVWTLPAVRNKGGRVRVIPLSAQAVALLRTVPRIDARVFGAADPFVLTARVRARLPGADWQARDLRRTAASLLGRLGFAPYEVSLALGHKDTGAAPITATYLRHDYLDRVREAFDRLGAWVQETVIAATPPGEVVTYRRARQ